MEQNKFKRLWKHWQYPRWRVEQFFPTAALQNISRKIAESERKHAGQIRFVVEARFDSAAVLAGITPHQRALQWFGELGVWDTEHNCGVLVYVSFADRAVEIVADRGISRKVPQEEWQNICRTVSDAFSNGRYPEGLQQGLEEADALLSALFPRVGGRDYPDDLANEVVLA
ncbi:TPM domain-containing protein [Neisseria chenwenguii]|uniref:TPM domain-containing protein n=1 Tax=Neisseria chenwenguii TaxID=1853278 RepID=A0A220S3A2_9NEIS|nr:TPM domain-containing protein [Neisseria chenwenguii]ASK27950.1 hypothetical protein BG910_09620 [Neisseria chenwenguii]ROV56201.1 hypothetical protein EGS38_05590 [Neisseria chenwenguii]